MKKTALAVAVVLGAAAVAWAQGQGTALSVSFDRPGVSCPDGDVTVDYTISTTAVSAAAVNSTLTGPAGFTPVIDSYDILAGNVPGGWTSSGRTKTFDGTFQHNGLADGTYTLEVCAAQAGSQGNPAKTVCKTQAIVVACAQAGVNPCASEAPFGEVVGNTQIKPHATAQIQFRGNFGSSAWVEIVAEGFYRTASIGRNGESCTYHANWKFNNESGADFIGNAGAGVYTVKVTGNANTLEFPVTLSD